MLTYNKIFILFTILIPSLAFAHPEGIYNPTSNFVGAFQGIGTTIGTVIVQPTGKILLVDGVSFILQVDAASKICRAGGC